VLIKTGTKADAPWPMTEKEGKSQMVHKSINNEKLSNRGLTPHVENYSAHYMGCRVN